MCHSSRIANPLALSVRLPPNPPKPISLQAKVLQRLAALLICFAFHVESVFFDYSGIAMVIIENHASFALGHGFIVLNLW